jgi:hypothetical protein
MRPAVLFLLLIAFSEVALAAPQQDAQVSPAQVQALLERIDKLEKRVAELEANASPAVRTEQTQVASVQPAKSDVQTPQNASSHAAHVDPAQGTHQQIAEAETFPSLKIRGFADVNFSASDQPGNTSGFSMGQFVLHFASPLSKKVSYFGEVSLTAQPNLYTVDLERSFIRYDVNDAAKISFGRYHTPINYWNTAFHHGSWLQTTISRPDMIRFGGTFEPVHFVGAQSEGSIPSGGLNLGYNVGIGNGRGSIFSRPGDNGDVNNNRAWLVNAYSRPSRFQHLQFGGSFYKDLLSASAAVPVTPEGTRFSEWIAAGHLVWASETPEFLAEFANVRHRSELTGHTFDSQGGYVQIAYRLPIWDRRWKPYFRYDYIQVPAGEPVFATVEGVRGATLGTRYDISDFAAFKAEYRNGRGAPGLGRLNTVVVQTAFTF